MDDEILYWIWLTKLPWIGAKTANLLLNNLGNPVSVYNCNHQQISSIPGISKRQIESILYNKSLDIAKHTLNLCQKHKIKILTQENELYKASAKKLADSPIILYQKGNLELVNSSVGIVGARRCTQDDKKTVLRIVNEQIEKGKVIVSGMAKGIDSYAHTACLLKKHTTIAILGNGLDICYPKEHNVLMKQIEENGVLLSEYSPGTPPKQYNFPMRNRIISAWSDELFVVASGKKSGANITAEYSKSYNRPVHFID